MKPSTSSRRHFIGNILKGGLATVIGSNLIQSPAYAADHPLFNDETEPLTGFDQTPLPYTYQALEDIIDAQTMEIHYSKHAAAYAKNAKEAALAEKVDISQPIETLLGSITTYSVKLRNNAGGHFNHELFWRCMRPKTTDNKPTGELMQRIADSFGHFDAFKQQFSEAAKTRFGSGWAWLCVDANGKLVIGSTANQDNPLMNISSVDIHGFPILCLDVWEHAYYLKYQNKRADYIQRWWDLVNWDFVASRLQAAK